ncbi:MAG: hypothetical protein J5676_04815 [Bacteroidaceae bacterium]|nr:hypothetical protein [Bacteroidaceae bacterium]
MKVKQKISLKRATFLSEQAYLDGNLNYESDFCKPIEKAAGFLRRFIVANKLEKYKTAKQIAVCDYMFSPWSGNDYKAFEYDFTNEYPDNDWHYQLVSRTLKNHKGQCHSLPWTMKLIAEEIGAEMYIARAPQHCFVMYRDADNLFPEEWVNVEVTSHQFQPTSWIKKNSEIKDSAIIVGTYLTPLSDKQALACILENLALSYVSKYKVYNAFTLKCASTSLAHYESNPTAIIVKAKSLISMLNQRSKYDICSSDCHVDIYSQIKQCEAKLNATYWTEITDELEKRLSKKQ